MALKLAEQSKLGNIAIAMSIRIKIGTQHIGS